jgi:hypothetical protein
MIQVANTYINNQIQAVPAMAYFYFYLYYRLFEATSHVITQDAVRIFDELIIKIRAASESEEKEVELNKIITHLENSKVGYANSLQGTSYYYLAFACLISKLKFVDKFETIDIDFADTQSLLDVVLEVKGLSAMQMIEEVRKVNDEFQIQLQKSFPDIFDDANSIVTFNFVKNQILGIDLDLDQTGEYAKEKIWQIHKYYIQQANEINVNPNSPADFSTEYIRNFTEHYTNLEFSETQMKEMSIYAFYSKHAIIKKQNDRQANRQEQDSE